MTTSTIDYAETLDYHVMPRDAGQIVEISYACDEVGVWQRVYDRCDQTTAYYFAPYYARATEDELCFEPWNGTLPRHNKFKKIR